MYGYGLRYAKETEENAYTSAHITSAVLMNPAVTTSDVSRSMVGNLRIQT